MSHQGHGKQNSTLTKSSASLNEQILDYYYKFGQNRDLEKYLRVRRNYNKSSSEGSLSVPSSGNCKTKENKSKSVEYISSSCSHRSSIKSASSSDGELIRKSNKKICVDDESTKKCESNKGVDSLKKSKSYSFKCESNINIEIPSYIQTVSMPNLQSERNMEIQYGDSREVFAVSECNLNENSTPRTGKLNNVQQTPESILKSTNKRLEWDSLGDVGYDKTKDIRKKFNAMSTLERSVLKEFFADEKSETLCAKESNINLEINSKKGNDRLSLISEEGLLKSTPNMSSNGVVPKQNCKEKWRETLENVKKKYCSSSILESTNHNKSIDKNGSKPNLSQFKNLSVHRHSTPKLENLEKFCQTSLVKTECQQIQCNFSNTSSVFGGESVASQSSFEYIPQLPEFEKTSSNKENISPDSNTAVSQTIRDDNQNIRISVSKLLQSQKQIDLKNTKTSTEVELGIQLLCTLIESRNLSDRQKKILAKKIVAKITKQQVSLSDSASSKSIISSSQISINSLIDSSSKNNADNILTSKQKQNIDKNNTDLEISGVEILTNSSAATSTNSSNKIITSRRSSAALLQNEVNMKLKEKNNSGNGSKNIKNIPNSQGNLINDVSEKLQNVFFVDDGNPPKENIDNEIIQSSDGQETMREWLEPLTRSEFLYNDKKKSTKDLQLNKNLLKLKIDHGATGDFLPTETTTTKEVFEIVEKEKKTHLNWIETEISRLENLKKLLLTEENSNKILVREPFEVQAYSAVEHFRSSKNIPEREYDNVAHSNRPHGSSKVSSSNSAFSQNAEIHREYSETDILNLRENYKTSAIRHKENVIYDEAAGITNTDSIPRVREVVEKKIVHEEKRIPKSRYEIRTDRSKLKTPASPKNTSPIINIATEETVKSYAKQKKREFIENYKKTHTDRNYDRPAESDHYSEPRNEDIATEKQQFNFKNDAYTSVTSSNVFISSDSVSIPISGRDSSTTTTHQYDATSITGIGVQTTDSVLATSPIFGGRSTQKNNICCCNNPRRCFCVSSNTTKPTVRVYAPGKSQLVQVKPKPIAYVIKFNDDVKNSQTKLNGKESEASLTLQEQFEKQRPEFYSKAIERQKILKEMQKLRQEREEKIRDIVENTSMKSIPRKLKQIPPPPTKYTRIFSTREMKAMTKRKHVKLPEVVEKVQKEKVERRKKGNKILTDVFNKRLQKRVHKGKLSLEHSRTVI